MKQDHAPAGTGGRHGKDSQSTDKLPEHGLDRKLTRYEGETWENFRVRLMMYADTCRLGGTRGGHAPGGAVPGIYRCGDGAGV